jgi:hypothetical protein
MKFLERIDEKGAMLKNKTTTLEMIGVLLPFLQIPEHLKNQHIVVKVDNIGCFFGWENLSVQGDNHASILTRTLYLVSSFLGCGIHLQHLPRMSSWNAQLADRLSWESTTTWADRELLRAHKARKISKARQNWLKDRTEDFSLATRILEEVEGKISSNLDYE